DDICTEYHPSSKCPRVISHFEDYGRAENSTGIRSDSTRAKPWNPFAARIDFEVADLVHDVAMTKVQTETLLSLLRRCTSGETIKIKNYKDITDKWEQSRIHHTPFKHSSISVQYAKKDIVYDVYHRPLWDWVLGLLDNPRLINEFVWDAQKITKWDGHQWEHFYHEPWTGEDWWTTQSKLPEGATPLALILYADKTRLSSFGTAKAYPVVARIANLPVHIRNSNGIGGGEVVGWLPIVSSLPPSERGKKNWVLHKNIVWHEAFRKILKMIQKYSKIGFSHSCADAIVRWLWPFILILSADYEEQCVMALIRGLKCNFPCPKCEVPKANLLDYKTKYTARTSKAIRQYLKEANAVRGDAREAILKAHGLRNVQNVFYEVKYTDILRALYPDRLHIDHGGLFPHHLWFDMRLHIQGMGRKALEKVDKQLRRLPRWRGLYHFDAVMHMTFTDGSKYEDLSKVIIFALHNVVTETACPLGYLLLKCLRSYLEVDMYWGFEVHLRHTIMAGRKAVTDFGDHLERYIAATKGTDFDGKDWGKIIKLHLWQHIFDEIEAKGVSQNGNTKPNEKLHGPLKKHFLWRSNFKNVAPQILRAEHISRVARLMREDLQDYDAMNSPDPDIPDDIEDDSSTTHVHLGAAQKPQTLTQLSIVHAKDDAFTKITIRKLGRFFESNLPVDHLPRSSNKIAIVDEKVNLGLSQNIDTSKPISRQQLTVDWRMMTDHLRRNPSFYNELREDCVIFQADEQSIAFVKLLFIFKCSINNNRGPYSLALVQPYDTSIPRTERPSSDEDLGLIHVRAQRRSKSRLIFVDSIIRGAMLVSTYDEDVYDEHFVVDIVDTDMFLRLKGWSASR
ncbi:hypothetical protein FIBSPDRAFT_729690, partial [Athelia psychrophila]